MREPASERHIGAGSRFAYLKLFDYQRVHRRRLSTGFARWVKRKHTPERVGRLRGHLAATQGFEHDVGPRLGEDAAARVQQRRHLLAQWRQLRAETPSEEPGDEPGASLAEGENTCTRTCRTGEPDSVRTVR